jgi:hypothetical protein
MSKDTRCDTDMDQWCVVALVVAENTLNPYPGFENVMPADRGFPKFLPRPAELQVVFDKPDTLTSALNARRGLWKEGLTDHTSPPEIEGFHAELTAIVEHGLDSLGNRVPSLTNK